MPTWGLDDGDINENNENNEKDCTLDNGKWYCKRPKYKIITCSFHVQKVTAECSHIKLYLSKIQNME